MKKKNLFKAVLLALFVLPVLVLASCSNAASRGYTLTNTSNETKRTTLANETYQFSLNDFLGKTFTKIELNAESDLGLFESYRDEGRDVVAEELYDALLEYRFFNYTSFQDVSNYDTGRYKHYITLQGASGATYYLETYFQEEDSTRGYVNNTKLLNSDKEEITSIIINEDDIGIVAYELYVVQSYILPEPMTVVSVDNGLRAERESENEMGGLYYTEPQSNYTDWEIHLFYNQFNYINADILKPDFEKNDYNFPVNVDNPESIESILSKIYATDETDGDVSDSVELVSTTYNPDVLVLGIHEFVVSVSDAAGNTRTGTFKITVFDIVKPVISGTSSYTVSYDEEISIETITAALTITDNFSSNLILNVVSDTYTDYENLLGQYTIVFNTIDEAKNTSDNFSVVIFVVDEKAPIITAPSIIEVSNNKAITLDEIKSKISIVDGHDGNITNYKISGYESYLENYAKVGNFTLSITAEDSSGNKTNANITLKVKDGISPEFYIYKDFVISIAKGTELTKEMIISYLSQLGEIEANNVESVSYELDSTKAGVYAVSIKMKDDTTYSCSIQVGAPVDNNKPSENTNNIFTAEFWKSLWDESVAKWSKFPNWNFINWAIVVVGGLVILLSIYFIRKAKKK